MGGFAFPLPFLSSSCDPSQPSVLARFWYWGRLVQFSQKGLKINHKFGQVSFLRFQWVQFACCAVPWLPRRSDEGLWLGGPGGRPLCSSWLSICVVLVPSGQVLSLDILFLISSVCRNKLTPGGQVGSNRHNTKNSRASSARILGEWCLLPQPWPEEALLMRRSFAGVCSLAGWAGPDSAVTALCPDSAFVATRRCLLLEQGLV